MIILLLCTTVFSLAPKTSLSQEKVIINQDESVSIDEVFNIIQQQTNYHFIFPKRFFQNAPNIKLEKGEVLVTSLLDKALHDSNLEFEVADNNVIVIKKTGPKKNRIQQRILVSGVVTDQSGMPMPGATVLIKGTSNGVATDIDGAYAIKVFESAVLEFSFVGYVTETIEVKSLTYFSNVNVVLKENINTLGEVVVTGYQTIAKERTAGAFTTVDEEQLQQRPAANFIDRINGQVSGLSVNPTSGNLEVRGRGTIITDSNPLFVVDGFPMSDQFNYESINPEDIESVTVLKDASAASIWGSKAANGVVVVVTKRGQKNSPLRIDFSTNVEIENKVDLDDFNWMSTAQEIDLDMEFIDRGWVNPSNLLANSESINNLHLAYLYKEGLAPGGNKWSQNTFDNYINKLKSKDVTEDYEDYLLRNAIRSNYNLSISGGGDRNRLFGSVSYSKYLARTVGDKDDRLTMNLNNTFEFNDKIKFTTGINAVLRNQDSNGMDITMASYLQPYDDIVDENGQYVQTYASWNPWVSKDREALLGSDYTYNILEEQRNNDNVTKRLDLRAHFRLDYEFIKDLTFSSSFAYESNVVKNDTYRSMDLPSFRNWVNDYYVNGDYQIPVGSEYSNERNTVNGWLFRNALTWDKHWGDHKLNVFVAGEYSKYKTENLFNTQFGYDKQTLQYTPIIETLVGGIYDFNNNYLFVRGSDYFEVTNSDNRQVSYMSNASYTFKDKYILNGSARIDQANIFGSDPKYRYKPLWSVSAAWEIHKESFMEDLDWMNRLKLRASYGLGGNSSTLTSPYAQARSVSINWGFPIHFSELTNPANPQLRWEEVATTNIGLDFGLFGNKLSGNIDYYTRVSTDLLGSTLLDPTNGFNRAIINYANAENKGFEIGLAANIISTKNFQWDVRANVNFNKNKVTKYYTKSLLDPDALAYGNEIIEGKPLSNIYAYNFAGLDQNGEVLLAKQDGSTVKWDETGDDKITADDMLEIGPRTPESYGGLSTTFKYKGLDLTVNMNYQADFWFINIRDFGVTSALGTTNNTDVFYDNLRVNEIWASRWKTSGDEATTNVPALLATEGATASMHRVWGQSHINYHKGDYIRVQDIILGYTFPQKYTDRMIFKNLRINLQVANPFLWTANDVGADPTALSREAYTNLPRVSFGLRTTF